VGVKGELGVGGAQGRDSYREGQSSSPAAPEAPAGEGVRGQPGQGYNEAAARGVPQPRDRRSVDTRLRRFINMDGNRRQRPL
jgi:hypothetical protein